MTSIKENVPENRPRFRLFQWNILARGLYRSDVDVDDTKNVLYDWGKFRLWRTLHEAIRFNSDLICLQEVDQYEEIKPFLHKLG